MRWLFLSLALLMAGCSHGTPSAPPEAEPTQSAVAQRPTDEETPAPAAGNTAACFNGRGPGDYIEAIERPEGDRSFRIHVPPQYDGNALLPLMFNFHGQGHSGAQQEAYSGLVPVADDGGFILVSPDGWFQQWNIVGVYAEDGIDDVGAVEAMLEQIESQFCVDPGRVFAAGISNGAQMASQVACLLPGTFAGIAPVAGAVFQGCEGPPVAVVAFQGTADYNVFFEESAPAVADWARYNGCPEQPESERVGEQVVVDSYFGCEGAPVIFYTLEEGGHTWPGTEEESGGVGPTNHEINASRLIWDLFSRVRRP